VNARPTFIGGPKDGALVPDIFWVLDTIEMLHTLDDGRKIVYYYELNADNKNYIYMGQEG